MEGILLKVTSGSLMARFFQKWRQRILIHSFRTCNCFPRNSAVPYFSRFWCLKMTVPEDLHKNVASVLRINWRKIMYHQIGSVMIVCWARCGKVVKLVCWYSLAVFFCKLEKRFIGCQMLSKVRSGILCEGSCPYVLQISVSGSLTSCVPTATEGFSFLSSYSL